ncbi:MAG TPA: ACT domain-containing protein [Trueperaceae bacterium]|nr:ACT domain-containing protein [Trueperaceae bacterium]
MVCRLEPTAKIPEWLSGSFISITRTREELSIVCEQFEIEDVLAEKDWRAFMVAGPLDFSEIGILAKLSDTLAKESISIFVISTYDTDYLLVKEKKLLQAIEAFKNDGHEIGGIK